MITLTMVALIAMPPPEWDHKPVVPYSVIILAHNERMDEYCEPVSGYMAVGCAVEYPDRWRIYLRNDLTKEAQAWVLRHEWGHVNSDGEWRH